MKWSNSLDMIILNHLCMQSCDVFRLSSWHKARTTEEDPCAAVSTAIQNRSGKFIGFDRCDSMWPPRSEFLQWFTFEAAGEAQNVSSLRILITSRLPYVVWKYAAAMPGSLRWLVTPCSSVAFSK